jgi:hypothetical protein
MRLNKFIQVLGLGTMALLLARPAAADSLVYGGLEDYGGTTGFEAQGDYNDMVFRMIGNITVIAPTGGLYALTSSMVNESQSLFFDQHSGDGAETNFGYCVFGNGNCMLPGSQPQPLNYVGTSDGQAPLTELFQAEGLVTIELLVKLSSGASSDSLGWFDASNPTVLHPIFAGTDGTGTTLSFTSPGIFGLYSVNPFGQFFSSIASDNVGEVTTHQHFAFAQDPIPEPGTASLAGIALVAGWAGRRLFSKLKS